MKLNWPSKGHLGIVEAKSHQHLKLQNFMGKSINFSGNAMISEFTLVTFALSSILMNFDMQICTVDHLS